MFNAAYGRRIRDEATVFCEGHRVGRVYSFGLRWLTCDLCLVQERGWRAWMWSVPGPNSLPEPADAEMDIHLPHINIIGVWDTTLCRMCAPTRAAAKANQRDLFFTMDWRECAKLMHSARQHRRLNVFLAPGARICEKKSP